MKKILLLAFVLLCSMFNIQWSMAYNQVRLVIKEGISNQQLKQQIERGVSVIITEINSCQEKNAPS